MSFFPLLFDFAVLSMADHEQVIDLLRVTHTRQRRSFSHRSNPQPVVWNGGLHRLERGRDPGGGDDGGAFRAERQLGAYQFHGPDKSRNIQCGQRGYRGAA